MQNMWYIPRQSFPNSRSSKYLLMLLSQSHLSLLKKRVKWVYEILHSIMPRTLNIHILSKLNHHRSLYLFSSPSSEVASSGKLQIVSYSAKKEWKMCSIFLSLVYKIIRLDTPNSLSSAFHFSHLHTNVDVSWCQKDNCFMFNAAEKFTSLSYGDIFSKHLNLNMNVQCTGVQVCQMKHLFQKQLNTCCYRSSTGSFIDRTNPPVSINLLLFSVIPELVVNAENFVFWNNV